MKKILLILVFVSGLLAKCYYKNTLPKNFYHYDIDLLVATIDVMKTDFPFLPYFGALIEHESCVTLKSKRCWSPKARLKTKREEGAGLFQITRVFNKLGRVRWDTLTTLKRMYPKELKDLNWDNIYNRPILQIKAGILLWYSNYRKLPKGMSIWNKIAFADSVFNGGWKYLNEERKICRLTKGCNDYIWFNNVEKIKSRRSLRILYGKRTAWDINRHHVRDVLLCRYPKYEKYYKKILKINKIGF